MDGSSADRIGRDDSVIILNGFGRFDAAVVFSRCFPIPPNPRRSKFGTDLIHILFK